MSIEDLLARHQYRMPFSPDGKVTHVCTCGEPVLGEHHHRAHVAAAIREYLLSDAVVEAAWDAMDAEHDKAWHVHAAECCWSFPNAARAALTAATQEDARDGA